jgi:hypothetical protein
MNSSSAFIRFFAELLIRLFGKNPKFFDIIQIIATIVAVITGVPGLLADAGVHLTGIFLTVENETVAISAIVAAIIAQLPSVNPPISNTTTTTSSTSSTTTTIITGAPE